LEKESESLGSDDLRLMTEVTSAQIAA